MTDASDTTGPFPRRASFLAIGEVLLVVAVCVLVGGDPAPQTNEPHYLCRAKHLGDANYCPGDFFLNSPDAHVTFVHAVGGLTRWLSLPAVAWIGRIVCWLLLAIGWVRLVRLVAPQPGFAVLGAAVWLVMIAQWQLAGEWIVGGFEAKCIAYALILFALVAVLEDRWNWAWGLLGFATAWHALVGAWSIVALAMTWLLIPGERQKFTAMLPGLVVGGLLGLIGVVPALWLSAGVASETAGEAARVYVYERLPHHLALLSMKTAWLTEHLANNTKTICWFVVASLVVALSRRHFGNRVQRQLAQVCTFAAMSLVIAMIGFAIEILLDDNRLLAASLLRFYWYRLADIIVPMAAALVAMASLAWAAARKPTVAAIACTALLIAVGVPLYQTVSERVRNPAAPTDRHILDAGDWRDACSWIRGQTPTDALFLTPRGNTSFKWFAERGEVITYKDVPQDAESLLEWRTRLNNVFRLAGDKKLPFAQSLGQLGTNRILQLAAQYKFNYVLTDTRFPLALPVVYSNDTYIVYRIEVNP